MDKGKRNELLFAGQLQMREAEGEEGKRTISGYAIRFNENSVKMDTWDGGEFMERISPSCVTDEFLKKCDIKMTLFHNREKLLARCNQGKGSLRLSVDKRGVAFEFECPDTELGRFCAEGVQRGDLSGCSFTFRVGDYSYEKEGDVEIVTHTRFDGLYEMTIGTDPAYPSTSVDCREFVECLKNEKDLREKEIREKELRKKEACRSRRLRLLDSELTTIL